MEINCIAIKGHPISEMYVRMIKPTWEEHGYSINMKNAVTPKNLVDRHELKFGIKKAGRVRDFTPTEKAVWYSHYDLWKSCVRRDKPMVIIEHDSACRAKLPSLDQMKREQLKFLSFIKRDFGKDRGVAVAPGSGYFITPTAAAWLVAEAVSSDVDQNSDGHLISQAMLTNVRYEDNIPKDKKHERRKHPQRWIDDYEYIEQINTDQLNTIDHKNPDRKFIGVDYEDFDLSSVYGEEV